MAEYIEKEAVDKTLCDFIRELNRANAGIESSAVFEALARIRRLPSSQPERKTNADRIRALDDEELAEWISKIMDCNVCVNMNGYFPCHNEECCPDHWLNWLKSSAKEDV